MRALIVGGGIGGMSCAIVLRRLGVACDLIDLDPEWRVYGAGITITRPTMRAFKALGILDELLEVGFAGDGVQVCRPEGTPVAKVADPDVGDDAIPGSGGVMRPELHRILSARTIASGTDVRLGITVDAIESDATGADVRFSDGSSGRYDLVIGADGVFSRVRGLIRPDAPKPEYTGQYIWRLFTPRPPEIVRRHFFLGGPFKIGVCPVSDSHLYLFLLETTERRQPLPDEEFRRRLREMLAGYGGVLQRIAETFDETAPIVVRPLEAFLLPPPWFSGRTLLVGDAAHPTTPHLASGAGLAVEDALVLGEELARSGFDVSEAIERFAERRWARCRLVVENSIEIGRLEQAGRPPEEQTKLLADSLAQLAEAI